MYSHKKINRCAFLIIYASCILGIFESNPAIASYANFTAHSYLDLTFLGIKDSSGNNLTSIPDGITVDASSFGIDPARIEEGNVVLNINSTPQDKEFDGSDFSIGQTISLSSDIFGSALSPAPSKVFGIGMAALAVSMESSAYEDYLLSFEVSAASVSATADVSDSTGHASALAVSYAEDYATGYPLLLAGDFEHFTYFLKSDAEAPPNDSSEAEKDSFIFEYTLSNNTEASLLAGTYTYGEASVVPIPPTIWLMGSALLGLGFLMKCMKPLAA